MTPTPRLALGIPAVFLQVCNSDTDLWTGYQYFGQQTCKKKKKYFNNRGRCQQSNVENIFINLDFRTNLDVWASPLWNVGVQYCGTNVHKLALTKRRWLYLRPGRLVCFLLKPV